MEGRMRNKVFTLVLLLCMIAVAGAWAQNLPGSIWTSPQSTATEGRYRSNADDFIRPDAYSGVKFNKWFGLVAFNSRFDSEGTDIGALATAGFATKVSKLYIGAFYSGDFWTWAPANNYTEQQFLEDAAPVGGKADTTYNVYSNINVVPRPVNNAAVLIGVADMGFRLTYRTNFQLFNNNNIVIGDDSSGYQLYKNYQAEEGYIAPQIAWAMAKNLTGNGIRPYATLDLVFNRDYQKEEAAGGTVIDDEVTVTGEKIGRSLNHVDPAFSAGLGGYTFLNKDGFRASFDFDYVLTLNLYDNEYSYEEDGKYKTATIKGTYSPATVSFIEKSYVSNLLTPSVSGQWSADKLALKLKVNLPVTIINEEQSPMKLNDSNKLVNTGASETSAAFIFRPDLRLALQYKIIPDRLTLNVGARIQSTAITAKTIDLKQYDEDGEKTTASKVHVSSFADNSGGGSRFVSRFNLGPTFNFTENCWVEANTGVTNAYGNNAIDVFASGGLFSFGSIMVGLKF
jgi:hypothetical protein